MKHQPIRWTPPQAEKTYTLYHFTIKKVEGKYVVEQVPDRPTDISRDNDSLLALEPTNFALNITWLDGKPAPNSRERNQGLIAILQDLCDILGRPDLITLFGIGHAYGATVHPAKRRK